MIKNCKRGHSEEAYVNTKGMAECRPCRRMSKTRYRVLHRLEARTYQKEYREKNLETCKAKKREYMRQQRKNNSEWIKEVYKRWAGSNPERLREYDRRWRKANPINARQLNLAYKARKRNAMSGEVNIQLLVEESRGVCGICSQQIGANYHIDHIRPLSRGGLHTQENLQVTHPTCNLKKSNRMVLSYA